MDIAQKFRDLFKEHPILNQFKGSHAPWLSDFKSLDEDIELKMDEPTQYLKDNFASIVGLLIYCSISCRPDLTTRRIQQWYLRIFISRRSLLLMKPITCHMDIACE